MVASHVIQKRIIRVNRRKPIHGIEVAIHSTDVGVEPLSPDDDSFFRWELTYASSAVNPLIIGTTRKLPGTS
ncbi:hypothetical protein NC651_025852 [Populus alba x Populus x berolinensis]|nr:hypothetical protein NC651_025852 [Populus alba x Populus x berolinensis]